MEQNERETNLRPLRVAVVGAGPAGVYASDILLRQLAEKGPELGIGEDASIDLFEKLPAPFGLVRYTGNEMSEWAKDEVANAQQAGIIPEHLQGLYKSDITREELDLAVKEFIAAYYGEAQDIIEEYFYMMRDLGADKHFTQYAALSGVLDLNRFNVMSEELSNWMDTLSSFDYERTETKDHVNRLRKGFGDMKKYA